MSKIKKSRKGKVMKETAAHRKAKLHLKRRNPVFRKHEGESRKEVTLAVEYMTHTMNDDQESRKAILEDNVETIESMGGIEGVHEFLDMLEALKEDWRDRLDGEGFLTVSALSSEGIDFAMQNEEDKAEAIG